MNRGITVLLVLALSVLFLCCFEDDENPLSPRDEDAPEADILSPASGETFSLGATITCIGTGVDPQDGVLEGASLVWRADQAVYLGTGDTIRTNALPAGPHTLILTVTDSDGKTDSDRISIDVAEEDVSLQSIWPNSDGDSWKFQYTGRWWSSGTSPVPYWPTLEEVPEIPTMEELEALLRDQPAGGIESTEEARYLLEFAGDTTTWSGVTAQNLRETFSSDRGAAALTAVSGAGDAFLSRLCVARPDLADKIRTKYPWIEADTPHEDISGAGLLSDLFATALREPILVHGYAWEKTGEWIGTYGDVDQDLAWKFLESNLRTGHQFSFQLVPSLASNVFLHCKVLRTVTAETRQGSFENSLECLYAIDYGAFQIMSEQGATMGYSRTFDYGSVIYAPGIGPVYSYERFLLFPGDQPTLGVGDLEISLIEAVVR